MGARHIGVGQETTWSTAVTPTRFFEALSESVALEKENETIETLRAYSPNQIVPLRQSVKGDVEILAGYHGIGILFKNLIGSVTTVTGSVNTHTFPATTGIAATDRVGLGLTIEARRDNQLVWTYAGAKITNFEQSFSTDQSSRMTFTVLAASATTSTASTTASYSTLAPMKPSSVVVLFDGTTISARTASISVENPVDESYVLGSTTLNNEPDRNGTMKVTGSVEALFTDFTQYNKFANGSDVSISIKSADSTYSITFLMTKCRLTSGSPTMQGRERLVATYEFESYYNSAATENLQITLVNADATP